MDSQRKSKTVIADDVDGCSNVLTTHSSQRASTATIETIRDLEQGNVGYNFSRQSYHSRVVVEELCEVLSSPHEDCEYDSSHEHAQPSCDMRGPCCAFRILRTKHIAHPSTGCLSNTEEDRLRDVIGSSNNTPR